MLDKGLSKKGKKILNSTDDSDLKNLSQKDKDKLNNNIKSDLNKLQQQLNSLF